MKLTPLYNVHLVLGATIITAAGYQVPAHYTSIEEEHRAVRERVGILDLALMGVLDIKGTDSLELVQELAVNDATKLIDGQAMYTTFCNEDGKIVDDVTVWRFNKEHFRVVDGPDYRYRTLKWIQDHRRPGKVAYVTDITSGLGMLSIQGPKSLETLQKLVDFDLHGLKFYHFVSAKLGDIPAIVARIGYTGELGYECWLQTEDIVQAWNNIMEAGKEFGIRPYGFEALDSLRFEKGFIFFGYDQVNDLSNPYEVGVEKWVRLDKPSFLGKEALTKISVNGPERKIVVLELRDKEIPPLSQPVEVGGKKVGETVAGFRGLTVGKNYAWAYVSIDQAKEGNEVTINVAGRKTPARVVNRVPYDPKGERMRLSTS
jgi:aminomethyltransferase